MSSLQLLYLFEDIIQGAIERLVAEGNKPLFKQAQLDRYLGIKTLLRISRIWVAFLQLGKTVNWDLCSLYIKQIWKEIRYPQDMFVTLGGVIEVVCRSNKPTAVTLAR